MFCSYVACNPKLGLTQCARVRVGGASGALEADHGVAGASFSGVSRDVRDEIILDEGEADLSD